MKALVRLLTFALALLLLAGCSATKAPPQELILATTTSTQDSGLLDVLIPLFEKQHNYKVKVIAVGSGQALALGERGEADVILAHAPASEQKLVEAGVVTNRHRVMHNTFIIVGPASDPAGIKGKSAAEALKAIADTGATFVSRGDDSGTHKKELELWSAANVKPTGAWYLESGTGMGQTLTIASEKQGYTLTDNGTYLAQRQRLDLTVMVDGDVKLQNIYHVMQVDPAKFAKVQGDGGKAFVSFMLEQKTQESIAQFGTDKYGDPLFKADALK